MGIGPEQGGYHPVIGSAIDCDDLALNAAVHVDLSRSFSLDNMQFALIDRW